MENASRGKLCTSSQKKARVPVWDCTRRLALYRVSLGFRSGIFSEKCLKRGKVDEMIENYVPWKKDCILQRTDGPKITFNVFSCSFLGFRTDTWLKRKSGTCQLTGKKKTPHIKDRHATFRVWQLQPEVEIACTLDTCVGRDPGTLDSCWGSGMGDTRATLEKV